MNILLTGITGFVGRYLLDYFVKQGHAVVGVGRNAAALAELGNKYGDSITPIRADLSRELDYDGSVDVVIHTAAQSPYNCSHISQYIDSNVKAASNIAQFARKRMAKGIVYFSSISIYGRVNVPVVDENTDIVNPDIYGMTKYLGEKILAESAKIVPVVALRLPGILGKGDHDSWLSAVLEKAISNEDIEIFNPQASFNNGVCPVQLADLIEMIICKDIQGFEAVTLGASEPVSVYDAVYQIITEVGSKSRIIEKSSNANSFTISIHKAKRKYNFAPYSTQELIKRYVGMKCAVKR
ncbi:MAG: NAD-dependent epimerase/dehydratase family protein [Planctomycetota bacterium]|jgi:nucleoside-diphosphate-sugar epimerase